MAELHDLIRDKIARLLELQRIPAKRVFVGRLGTLTVTLYGEASALKVAALVAPFAKVDHVGPGFDPGKATEIHNARRTDVPVWRVHGTITA